MIIELCGIPGCGKSTALKLLKEKDPGLLEGAGGWKKIYPRGNSLRRLYRLFQGFRNLLGIMSADEKLIWDIMDTPQKKAFKYRSAALTFYRRLKKAKGFFLLDEGLVQRMSSAAYGHRIRAAGEAEDGGLKTGPEKGIVSQGGTGIRIADAFCEEYIVIRFECSIDDCMLRNRLRGRNNRYNPADEEQQRRALEIKRDNINALVSLMGCRVFEIDTSKSPAECAGELEKILRSIK